MNQVETPIKVGELVEYLRDTCGTANIDGKGSEIITFCPFCERKRFFSNKHGHCYINVQSLKVNCFKCEQGRTFFTKIMKAFGTNAKEFLEEGTVISDWVKYIKTRRTRKDFDIKRRIIREEELKFEDKYEEKRNYIKSRLGFDVQIENIPGMIFGISNFIRANKISIDDTTERILEYLDTNFVGFLTSRGTTITCRNTDPSSDFRYYNIQLSKNNYFKDFYSIKTNPIKKEKNKIIITEGIFDVLVPYRHEKFKELKEQSCLWAACLGCSFTSILLSSLDYCKVPKADFVILADQGIPESKYEWVFKSPFVNSLEIWWNRYNKDFGELPIDIVTKKFTIDDCKYVKGKKYAKTRNSAPC